MNTFFYFNLSRVFPRKKEKKLLEALDSKEFVTENFHNLDWII